MSYYLKSIGLIPNVRAAVTNSNIPQGLKDTIIETMNKATASDMVRVEVQGGFYGDQSNINVVQCELITSAKQPDNVVSHADATPPSTLDPTNSTAKAEDAAKTVDSEASVGDQA